PTVEPSSPSSPAPDGAFVVAHLGAIGEGRDLAPAIAAVSTLRAEGLDVRLLLAGRTGIAPPEHDGVVATGPLDHAALSRTLAGAGAYLFAEPTGPTSRKTSLLSALAHGLPIVAYAGPDAEPHFRDEENLLLVQPDAGSIASALRRLAGDGALRERLGAAAGRLAAQRYSWRTIAETVRTAAAEAAAGPRQRTGA
ncbi:MAG: glycosyltransferase, partial [Actinomycetota bacterium]